MVKKSKEQTEKRFISQAKLYDFAETLREEEKSKGTIEKYIRDVKRLQEWLGGKELTRERVLCYKEALMEMKVSINSINSYLVSANVFFDAMGWGDLRVKTYRVQQEMARADESVLSKREYARLLAAAKRMGNEILYLILEVLASTGMRISEVKFITVESVCSGIVQVYNKGKVRRILLTAEMQKQLKAYINAQGLTEGIVFQSRKGTALSRTTIWRWMKKLSRHTSVDDKKVFPHNFRKLFATELYDVDKDIARVADVLGHSSVNTTRCYIRPGYSTYLRELEHLGLVGAGWAS